MNAHDTQRHILYEAAVQFPEAEVALLLKIAKHTHPGEPYLLHEAFCGTAALSSAWVRSDYDRQAVAVDHDMQLCILADHLHGHEDLHIICDDCLKYKGPNIDIMCALNFSALYLHQEAQLIDWFTHARNQLNPHGCVIVDVFGGQGATVAKTQSRHIAKSDNHPAFTYHWQQKNFDPVTRRIDCHIHFNLDGQDIQDAFVYHWTLHQPETLIRCMRKAGLTPQLWCDPNSADNQYGCGIYQPMDAPPQRQEWIAYIVGTVK